MRNMTIQFLCQLRSHVITQRLCPAMAVVCLGASAYGQTVNDGLAVPNTLPNNKYCASFGAITSNFYPVASNWNYNLLLNGLNDTSIGFHDSAASVSSIRYSNAGFVIGGDDGWGVRPVTIPGGLNGLSVNGYIPGQNHCVNVGTNANNQYPTNRNFNYNILLNGLDWTSIGFHDSANSVSSIRYSDATGGFFIGGDDGWGVKNTTFPGCVGIGITASSAYKLAVNGTIRAREIRVENTGWGDYVFDPEYKLMPLGEVAQHVAEKRHLPGIPSAADIERDGLGVSDMVGRHMVKIEELTLYTIDLHNANEALKAENAKLQTRLAAIEAALGMTDGK